MHTGLPVKSEISVQQLEATAWLAWAEGKPADALETMRTAVAKEEFYGVESRTVPAYEMLGDLLLELHQPKPALVAYAAALKERLAVSTPWPVRRGRHSPLAVGRRPDSITRRW